MHELSSVPCSIVTTATAAPSLTPAEAMVLVTTENEKQLFVSFQEHQKNKMVCSPSGPKASSAFSLSATSIATGAFPIYFIDDLCRPVGISYNCPSPAVDQDKSSDGATPQKKRGEELQPQTPRHPEGATNFVLCSLSKPCRRFGLLNLSRMPHPSEQSAAVLALPS